MGCTIANEEKERDVIGDRSNHHKKQNRIERGKKKENEEKEKMKEKKKIKKLTTAPMGLRAKHLMKSMTKYQLKKKGVL